MAEQQTKERLQEVKGLFETPQWYLKGRSYHVQVRTAAVQHLLQGADFKRVLDIGCGDGSISVPLLQPGRHLTLLDMSQAMLEIARSRVPANLASAVEVINSDVLGAKLPAASFDVVICVGVFAYFPDPTPLIQKLHSILKPGGILIVECSDSAHFVTAMMRLYDRMKSILAKPKFSTNPHTAKEIVDGFLASGFQLNGSYRYSAPTRISRKLFSQPFHYWKIKTIFGEAAHPRCQSLGNECIFWFKKLPERAATGGKPSSRSPNQVETAPVVSQTSA